MCVSWGNVFYHHMAWYWERENWDASVDIGFQVTISKYEMQNAANLFPLLLNWSILDLNFSRAVVFDFSFFFSKDIRFGFPRHWWVIQRPPVTTNYTKIVHNIQYPPWTLIFMMFIFQWLQLNRVTWTKISAVKCRSEPAVFGANLQYKLWKQT